MFRFLNDLKYVPFKKFLTFSLILFSTAIITTGIVVAQNSLNEKEETEAMIEQIEHYAEPYEPTGTAVREETLTVDDLREQIKFSFSITSILRGLLGIAALLLIAFLLSGNRKAINWKTVITALIIQIVLAICILYVPFIRIIFEYGGKIFVKILDFTKEGSIFLFGDFMDSSKFNYIFALQVLPTIIFFSAITSLLFYLGVIQWVVKGVAWLMTRTMKLSGVEGLSLAGNIFLGQTEAPLLVKAYLSKVNASELFIIMSGGMATMAGGVLAAYIGLLGGDDPVMRTEFAKHLLSASVMAAPGVIVISKIMMPQTEPVSKDLTVSKEKVGANILDAFSNGTSEGVKLAVNVAGMLLTFIALIALVNYILGGLIGNWTGLNEYINILSKGQFTQLSLQFILAYACSPLMWLIGAPSSDIFYLGQLLGEKTIINEFVGYASLEDMKTNGLLSSPKSIIIGTYLLCGFANFSSIGIQIGGIGSLASNKRGDLSRLGLKALLAAAMTALLSTTIIAMILN
ncbi:MAG: Na+ dependent nucleoside transporter [Bacteroidales bacterium]|jgi:CNT family concentrative nucleoside transporter|nr:Na+ dependent nucleoside transporter [Bacteroidales bacterium]